MSSRLQILLPADVLRYRAPNFPNKPSETSLVGVVVEVDLLRLFPLRISEAEHIITKPGSAIRFSLSIS